MYVYGILLYNLVLLEFLCMAVLAWHYNGLATRGMGRYFGPFALMAASVLLSTNLRLLLDVRPPLWVLFAIWTLMGLFGLRVVTHMCLQVYRAKQSLRELEKLHERA